MTRKTIPTAVVIDNANRMLDHAATPEERRAIASFVSSVLLDVDAYRGFRYVGTLNAAGTIDDTRRHYYGEGLTYTTPAGIASRIDADLARIAAGPRAELLAVVAEMTAEREQYTAGGAPAYCPADAPG